MVVAVELESGHVVVGAQSTGNRQALVGLHIPELVDAVGPLVQPPTARRIAVAVELYRRDVVVGARSTGNRQALAGLAVDEHHLVADWVGAGYACGEDQTGDKHG